MISPFLGVIEIARGSAKRWMLPEMDSFYILKVDQNILLIYERSRARRGAAMHNMV